ncbi:hybrid sensor histidine kinase/response regulator [Paucibacter sp. XJ19-41]|uniref:hybrid sensor histidine kinase/response regulator n=1 Tax=Paucibacter sp. XJ19-41 TaxID=2927824 RepID=UPI00234A0368|nr:ATP-binding protein [Paucibacter sp. XJ19-41]MDC6168522.1 ATP-binding protein [Paucibacter sp. XJ19-41]
MPVAPPSVQTAEPVQRVIKIRRDYNAWVASETLEDYALRFTPHSFRRWSGTRVANTAFGAASFLVLEAVGATLLVEYGFANAFWAILATGLIILLAGWPISVYAARYGVDMDLLTRGAGFGYIGSTLTSLIYASFTFIFFALEAAIMAYALELAFDIPPAWGYLICALVVLPLVTHGVTAIARLQVWTQPLWLVLLIVPYVYVFIRYPELPGQLQSYAGADGRGGEFSLPLFGAAMTVGIALITQMGEQADYLRFMPEPDANPKRRWRWWAAVFVGGPGWVVLGVAKMLGGALLAYLAMRLMVPTERAVDPNQMYLVAYDTVFSRPGLAVAATALLVIVSQLKINVTNAYAGSLAWSNFFARLTHSHPGRVVWVVFNTLIALILMEMELFQALDRVLGLYANIAIAWIMTVVADLVINKPLGLSPPGIEFKRAHLYDINPVGVGAMAMASLLSIAAHLGLFGTMAQAFSALIALVTAMVCSPLIAWATGGRYYIARQSKEGGEGGAYKRLQHCVICERAYEGPDMAHCPAYQGPICSLCCSLDARCDDLCKPDARLATQARALLQKLLPRKVWPLLDSGLTQSLGLMALVLPVLVLLFGLLYQHELGRLGAAAEQMAPHLRASYAKALVALLLLSGVIGWWLVLTHKSRQVAQEESRRQSQALHAEIESHRQTDAQLQQAKVQADAANEAKTRYITNISHELRTPLNSILGYAQILDEDERMPAHRKQAITVIRRGGEHLLSLIEGSLDLARIEAGRFKLEPGPWAFGQAINDLVHLLSLQAAAKGLDFIYTPPPSLPDWVRADGKRVQQILINILGNAIKFTPEGKVTLRLHYAREMARFEIEDSGPGMSAEELERVFEPFERGAAAVGSGSGTGLGLTIAKMLTDLMGGELKVASTPGFTGKHGTRFELRLFLPSLHAGAMAAQARRAARIGFEGPARRLLVVDNEEADRNLLRAILEPLGFELRMAASGIEAMALIPGWQPEALLLDLAMPGLDGWQTLAEIRVRGLSEAPAVIISANAFDRGLDNGLGVSERDFIVKPVRVDDLLDWLGRRLNLDWRLRDPVQAADANKAPLKLPSREALQRLQQQLSQGHVKGIYQQLDRIAGEDQSCSDFVTQLRAMARQFELQAMSRLVARALQAKDPA